MRLSLEVIQADYPDRSELWYRGYLDYYLGVELEGFHTSKARVTDYDRGWYRGYLDLRASMRPLLHTSYAAPSVPLRPRRACLRAGAF